MDIKKVTDYVGYTPHNVNLTILRQLIDPDNQNVTVAENILKYVNKNRQNMNVVVFASALRSTAKRNFWKPKKWNSPVTINAGKIWTTKKNVYYSDSNQAQLILNKETDTWEQKTWNGFSAISGLEIWIDGEDTWYTYRYSYILNEEASTFKNHQWNNPRPSQGHSIWTDGKNVYYSTPNQQYILNKDLDVWEDKNWIGLKPTQGSLVWTDGEDIYYSDAQQQYILNKSTDTWEIKDWGELLPIYGDATWTDGENVYYSYEQDQYVLNRVLKNGSQLHGEDLPPLAVALYGRMERTFITPVEKINMYQNMSQNPSQSQRFQKIQSIQPDQKALSRQDSIKQELIIIY